MHNKRENPACEDSEKQSPCRTKNQQFEGPSLISV